MQAHSLLPTWWRNTVHWERGQCFLRYVSSDHSAFAVYWGNILAVTSVVGGALVVALDVLGPRLLNPASAALVLMAAISQCVCAQLIIESGRVFQTFERCA